MRNKVGVLLAFGLSCGLLGSGAASAQTAGVYSGTSLDGQGISITVALDTGTGFYEINSATVWYNAICTGNGAGTSVYQGTGWDPGTEISGGTGQMTLTDSEESIIANLKFHSFTNSFTGNISTRLAELVPNGAARPVKAARCDSDWQPLNLYYVGPAKVGQQYAKGATVRLKKLDGEN